MSAMGLRPSHKFGRVFHRRLINQPARPSQGPMARLSLIGDFYGLVTQPAVPPPACRKVQSIDFPHRFGDLSVRHLTHRLKIPMIAIGTNTRGQIDLILIDFGLPKPVDIFITTIYQPAELREQMVSLTINVFGKAMLLQDRLHQAVPGSLGILRSPDRAGNFTGWIVNQARKKSAIACSKWANATTKFPKA